MNNYVKDIKMLNLMFMDENSVIESCASFEEMSDIAVIKYFLN